MKQPLDSSVNDVAIHLHVSFSSVSSKNGICQGSAQTITSAVVVYGGQMVVNSAWSDHLEWFFVTDRPLLTAVGINPAQLKIINHPLHG